jgi:coatomer protein complex subunit alpha (xenin)
VSCYSPLTFVTLSLFTLRLCADPLAYMTAKTNGLTELAQEILDQAGLTVDDVAHVKVPASTTPLKPPSVITPTADLNWPPIATTETFFDKALNQAATVDSAGHLQEQPAYVNGTAAEEELDAWEAEGVVADEPAEDAEDAWDIAPTEPEEGIAAEGQGAEESLAEADGASPGVSETQVWVRNSPLAADHVAAGSFETAMQVRFPMLPPFK